jgi:hypothetical protein
MKFTLTKLFLDEFLNKHDKQDLINIEDPELREIINRALDWECEVSLLTYFFAKRIQRKQNFRELNLADVENFFCLETEGYFSYQNFDRDFITYMFDYSRSRMSLSLEDLIVEVQQDYFNNIYESNFRY